MSMRYLRRAAETAVVESDGVFNGMMNGIHGISDGLMVINGIECVYIYIFQKNTFYYITLKNYINLTDYSWN